MVITIFSGVPLIFDLSDRVDLVIDLAHAVAGFALLILLCSHLVLVIRVTLDRLRRAGVSESDSRAAIVRQVMWYPLLVSCAVVALLVLL